MLRLFTNHRGSLATLLSVTLLSAGLLALSGTARAQERGSDQARVSPNATLTQTVGTTQILLTYGRPHVNDREIFGGLVPHGEVWRTGANEATYINFPTDVLIEGEALPAGEYSIYTIPGPDEWTVIFNENANQWGLDYDSSADALRVTTTPEEAPHREMVTFTFHEVTDNSAELVLRWADVRVPVSIELDE